MSRPRAFARWLYIDISLNLIGKTKREYNRLCRILNRVRRARSVPIDLFRNGGFSQKDADFWTSAEHIEYNIRLMVLPTAPAKRTDDRSFSGLTTQYALLNAVPPADTVLHSIESRQNNDMRQAVIDIKASIHNELYARCELYTV